MNLEETRARYGQTLVELAKRDARVVALDCDLGRSTHAYRITEVDPSRFFEMGIAEQDMISTAAGLAKAGKIPFANSFAVFITGRGFDQIRQQVALPKSNVKICGSSAGITQGPDGATHQSIVDVALMRSLPNMTVLIPADGNQTQKAVEDAYEIRGPVYLRLSRYKTENFTPDDFQIGKAVNLLEGSEVAICSTGPITWNVVRSRSILEELGIRPTIVNFHTIKPIDDAAVIDLAGAHSIIFSVEEHSVYGGLGSALAEVLAEMPSSKGRRCRLVRLGVQDHFGESGTADELLAKFRLDPAGIAGTIKDEISK